MPELKNADKSAWVDVEVDVSTMKYDQMPLIFKSVLQWSTFAYADKKREIQRVATLKAAEDAAEQNSKNDHKKKRKGDKNEAWSDQKVRKAEREKRKEKKDKKKAWQKANQAATKADAESANAKRKQTDDDNDSEDDWDELAREERMAKKVKKGEVDSKAFDQEFADLQSYFIFWPVSLTYTILAT